MDRHLKNWAQQLIASVLFAAASGAAYAEKDISQLPDPTRPQNIAAQDFAGGSGGRVRSDSPWLLESTLIAENRRSAVINGRTYRVGDAIGDAKLVAIESYEVLLEKGSKQIRLRLLPSIAKSEHSAAEKQ